MSDQVATRGNDDTIARINAIPGAMRQMGWMTSAALMDRWTRSAAWRLPDSWKGENALEPLRIPGPKVDQRIVKMGWALRYPRVRAELQVLRAKMANAAARRILRERLIDTRWGGRDKFSFGSKALSALELDSACQANFVKFGGVSDTMDDLYGGLGRGTLKVALIGEATREPRTGTRTLKVTHAGFYIRDTYDFNGAQYLGRWTSRRVFGKALTAGSIVLDMLTVSDEKPQGHLSNGDFETYRRLTGFGGDFVVYSDVLWEPIHLTLDLG